MTQFTIEMVDHYNGTVSLKLKGSFDSKNMQMILSSDIDPLLAELRVTQAQRVIVDLSTTHWLDARGVAFLLKLHQELAGQNTTIILCNPSPHLSNIFRIMQLEQVFTIENQCD